MERCSYLSLGTDPNYFKRRRAAAVSAIALLLSLAAAWCFSDERTQGLLVNSLFLAVGSAALALPLGTGLALMLFRTDLPGRRWGLLALVVLLFLPLHLQVAGWDAGFGKLGWHSLAFAQLGKVPWLDGWRAAILLHAMSGAAWVAVIVGAALVTVKPEYEEQAALEGSLWRIFARVTLPQVIGPMFIAAVWVMVMVLGEMTVTDIYRVRTFAEELYVGYALDGSAHPLPRESLPGWLALACVVWLALMVCSRLGPPDDGVPTRPPFQFQLGRWRMLLGIAVRLILALMLVLPLANLLVQAGITVDWEEGGPIRRWSGAVALLEVGRVPWRFAHEFGWTFLIASTAAMVTLLVSLPLAWFTIRGGWRRLVIVLPAGIGLAVPGPAIGLAIIALFNQPSIPLVRWLYDHSIAAPVLALVVRSLPVTLLILWHTFAHLARDPFDNATLEGASSWQRFWKVAVPQRKSSIVAVWLVGLAIGVGDLSATILVTPPGVTTLSNRIFTLLHYGVEEQLAALCLTEVVLIALVAWAVTHLVQRGRPDSW